MIRCRERDRKRLIQAARKSREKGIPPHAFPPGDATKSARLTRPSNRPSGFAGASHRTIHFGRGSSHSAIGPTRRRSTSRATCVEPGSALKSAFHCSARAFGCSTRSLRRHQAHYEGAGLEALVRGPGRPPGEAIRSPHGRRRDQAILALENRAASNRPIAGKLGIDERVVRRTLRRLDWQPAPDARLPFSEQTPSLPAASPPALANRRPLPPRLANSRSSSIAPSRVTSSTKISVPLPTTPITAPASRAVSVSAPPRSAVPSSTSNPVRSNQQFLRRRRPRFGLCQTDLKPPRWPPPPCPLQGRRGRRTWDRSDS